MKRDERSDIIHVKYMKYPFTLLRLIISMCESNYQIKDADNRS